MDKRAGLERKRMETGNHKECGKKKKMPGMTGKQKVISVYLFSFFVPVFIMMAIYASLGIGYHGKLTVLSFDLKAQYAPFIAGLRYLLKDPGSILFNWNNSLGGNYLGTFAYYLGSPLNLLTLLWKTENIAQAIYVLTLVKIGFCGLSFAVYLHRSHPDREISYTNILFSLCYALMSFNIAYCMNIMWLDAVILFPLVILGVDRILEGKKGGVFFAGILLTFISNYYMSYMVGIFTFLYFLFKIFAMPEKQNIRYYIRRFICFGINTLLALGVAMPLLLPSIISMKKWDVSGTLSRNMEEVYKFNPGALLMKFLPSQFDSLYSEGGKPFIFCGTIMWFLVVLFFIQKRNRKEKITSFLLLFIVFLGFIFPGVDFIWHGMRYPNDFPYRYAFLFSGYALMVGYEAWIRLEWKEKGKQGICIVMILYTVVEMYLNGTAIVSGIYQEVLYENAEENAIQNELYAPLAAKIRTDDGFYRMGTSEKYVGFNVESMYGLNGTDYFSSSHNSSVKSFLRHMGGASDYVGMTMTTRGFTPLMDSITGIKYRIGIENPAGIYKETATADSHGRELKLFQNENALNVAFMVDPLSDKTVPEWENDPFANQWMLLDYLGIEDSCIYWKVPYNATVNTRGNDLQISVLFQCETENPLYCYLDATTDKNGRVSFYLDGELFFDAGQLDVRRVLELPEMEKGKEHILTITGPLYEVEGFFLCAFDIEAYISEIGLLQADQLEHVSYKGNQIRGSVEVKNAGTLFTTIPYDDGFTVYVDGNKTEYEKALDTFLCVELTPGRHEIQIIYNPPGLFVGLLIMIFSVLGTVVFYQEKFSKKM